MSTTAEVQQYRVPIVGRTPFGDFPRVRAATILELRRELSPANCPNKELGIEVDGAWRALFRALMAFQDVSGKVLFEDPEAEYVIGKLNGREPGEILAEAEQLVERNRAARVQLDSRGRPSLRPVHPAV